jgi:hexosaminidase
VILPILLAIAAQPSIIPKPVSVVFSGKTPFRIDSTTQIRDDRNLFASGLLHDLLRKGAKLDLKRTNNLRLPGIEFQQSTSGRKESYDLVVTSSGIKIQYGDEAGALYAVETLRQLLPPEIDSPKGTNKALYVPAVEIHDAPRFPWRGMHLDVSRHFFKPDFIKRYIDYIAMMKMNVFHWHLVDDGGWRIQIDKYPKLTSVGSTRFGVTDGWDQSKLRFDPESKLPSYGGYYTKAQIRDIVQYAADRNITVVPEIEMPGHAMPVFAAYPDLICQNQVPAVQAGQPASNVYCAGNDKTYQFVEDVLTEVMELFPSKWIHIGGDEVSKGYWKRCPLCQGKIKSENLKDEDELQSYFIRRVDKFLTVKGRRLIGWDEILEGGLAQGATVMSWRGIEGGIAAAKSGHDVVMSPTSHCYFDFAYSGQSTEHVYTFEPVPESLTSEEAKHILGGQANVWTEWISTEARCEYMIWPRMAAMAETLWSTKESRDINDFTARVGSLINRLDIMGVNYYIPAPRVPLTAIVYADSARVEATVDPAMPGKLHYSYGNSPIGAKSDVYKSPLYIVGDRQTVNFAYVSPNGRLGDTTRVVTTKSENIELANPVPGWMVSAYEGKWDVVPTFIGLKPVKVETAQTVSLASATRAENFALRFEGYLKIDEPGVYSFSVSSDDGSYISVAGAKVVDNDGPHGTVEKTGSVLLPKGWHRIEIGF